MITSLFAIEAAALLFILIAIPVVVLWRRAPRLSADERRRLRELWRSVSAEPDPRRRVLDGDAVLHQVLSALGFEGSVGEQLRSADPLVPNLDAVWKAHKLRNRIAHEVGVDVSPRDARRAMEAFGRVVRKFCA